MEESLLQAWLVPKGISCQMQALRSQSGGLQSQAAYNTSLEGVARAISCRKSLATCRLLGLVSGCRLPFARAQTQGFRFMHDSLCWATGRRMPGRKAVKRKDAAVQEAPKKARVRSQAVHPEEDEGVPGAVRAREQLLTAVPLGCALLTGCTCAG